MTPLKGKTRFKKSLNVDERFPWANKEQKEHIEAEAWFQYTKGLEDARFNVREVLNKGIRSMHRAVLLTLESEANRVDHSCEKIWNTGGCDRCVYDNIINLIKESSLEETHA